MAREIETSSSQGDGSFHAITVGSVVRVKKDIRPFFGVGGVPHTSIGTVTETTTVKNSIEVVHVFFPEHFHWTGFPSELIPVSTDQLVQRGDLVQLRQTVRRPRYNWGKINVNSQGVVESCEEGGVVIVDFPEQRSWKGLACELETVQQRACAEITHVESSRGHFFVKGGQDVSAPKYLWRLKGEGEDDWVMVGAEDECQVLDIKLKVGQQCIPTKGTETDRIEYEKSKQEETTKDRGRDCVTVGPRPEYESARKAQVGVASRWSTLVAFISQISLLKNRCRNALPRSSDDAQCEHNVKMIELQPLLST